MSAADDRMAVRTPSGYRSVPRRAALGMIATGRATSVRRDTAAPRDAGVQARAELVTVDVQPGVAVHEVTGTVTPAGEPLPEAPEPVPDEAADEAAPALPIDGGDVMPRGNASRDVWADYARTVGVTVTDDMTRNAVRDAARAATDSARLSQPALTGGRLANPEDEPVTEAVTSVDPGIR